MTIFLKFLKFGVVGFSGMLIDFGVTWLLKERLKINAYVANSIGFITAASSNYFWNRLWTFESENQDIPLEYMSFIIISVVGLLINNLMVYLLTTKFKLNFYLAKLLAIGVVTLWNFGMNFLITFSQR